MSAAPRRSAQSVNRRMDPKCAKLPAIVAATTIGIPRAMPNAPATVHEGIAGICAGSHAAEEHLALAEDADVIVFGSEYRTARGHVDPQASARRLLDGGVGRLGVGRLLHGEPGPLERLAQQRAHALVVVDHQHDLPCRSHLRPLPQPQLGVLAHSRLQG